METEEVLQIQGISPKAGVYQIRLSEGTSFLVRPEYAKGSIDFSRLTEGSLIGASEKEALLFASSCYRIEREALRYISRAEQTKKGLFQKLHKKGHDRDQISRVIQFLENKGLVDDERYAASYISYRLGRGLYTPRQLLRALVARGIELALARQVYHRRVSPLQEREMLLRFVQKKGIADFPSSKLKQSLMQAGFRKDLVTEYLLQKNVKGNL